MSLSRTAVFSPSRAPPAARVNRRHGIAFSHSDGGAPLFCALRCAALRCDFDRRRCETARSGGRCVRWYQMYLATVLGCACESGQGAVFMGWPPNCSLIWRLTPWGASPALLDIHTFTSTPPLSTHGPGRVCCHQQPANGSAHPHRCASASPRPGHIIQSKRPSSASAPLDDVTASPA
jgi:hypothetical protein